MRLTHPFSIQDTLGTFSIREIDPQRDAILLHAWVCLPYAHYWLMQGLDVREVEEFYTNFNQRDGCQAYLGFHNSSPSFIVELYDPHADEVGKYFLSEPGDIGMHLLVAPTEFPRHGFTRSVFNTVMKFIFSQSKVNRIVVEPDHRNKKIHALNILFGFQHTQKIQLKDKVAYLGFCSRNHYNNAIGQQKLAPAPSRHSPLFDQPALITADLDSATWAKVNTSHIAKCLAELCHERVLQPILIDDNSQTQRYRIHSDHADTVYEFSAKILPLNHWHIPASSINKVCNGNDSALDSVQFILEFAKTLALSSAQLPVYIEEISATLYSSAYKHNKSNLLAKDLCIADFQTIESSMTEGHPSFIANNGRIGFDAVDFQRYTPEAGTPIRLVWLAVHRSRAEFSHCSDLSYEQLIESELDITTRIKFDGILVNLALCPNNFLLMPVHPWQWFNKVYQAFATDIANRHIVCLGYSGDSYQAQQSIRTFFNINKPEKFYVKTALSILNMGFTRGLSAAYMKVTPAINDWLHSLIEKDDYLQKIGFSILREIAAIGYNQVNSGRVPAANDPTNKMLAALWRESPVDKIAPHQNLMTMAALLHIDNQGDALLPALIDASPLETEPWLTAYLQAYLSPLLHCYFKHSLVFMPHGENVILIMENSVPIRIFMKDIGEEICILNSAQNLPKEVSRIAAEVPKEQEVLAFFTDIFDGFFRYLSVILFEHKDFEPNAFWKLVADCIKHYQRQHPQYNDKYREHDLFSPHFQLSCLNRLQLRNNQQMIDLSNPSKMLQFSGEMINPIAEFRHT
ncbi:MAG: GNAT family N-acetyltransferase [Gammaproteobacteria bacterium]|nr:GNAT family N-acetyltransferase [Gammaproteobacteria bacterium]